jgi:DNA-binding MarR family transcriptional regulator
VSITTNRRSGREEALERLGSSFKGAMAAVRRLRGRDTHRPGELSFAQYHLLFGLAERGVLSTGELALAADLTPATVTQMLDGLGAMGLVERLRSERDRRIVTCSLTARGREMIAERRARFESRWQAVLAEFSTEELTTAAAVMDRLRAMFDETAPNEPAWPGRGAARSDAA